MDAADEKRMNDDLFVWDSDRTHHGDGRFTETDLKTVFQYAWRMGFQRGAEKKAAAIR